MWPFGRKKPLADNYPEAMIAAARQNPGGWVYDIDAAIGDPNGEVPPFAIKGARKVNHNGEIIGDFELNKNYDPAKTREWVAARDARKE